MSTQEQNSNELNGEKELKSKQQRQKQKDNTNAWLRKQEQKKKKKMQEQEGKKQQKSAQLDEKALQKARRKQQKRLERQQMLKQQQGDKQKTIQQGKQEKGLTQKKSQLKVENVCEMKNQAKISIKKETKIQKQTKNQTSLQIKKETKPQKEQRKTQKQQKKHSSIEGLVKKTQKKNHQQNPAKYQQFASKGIRKLSANKQSIPLDHKIIYNELLTLQQHLKKSSLINSFEKTSKQKLIFKYLDQYITPNDTILVLSRQDKWHPQSCQYRRVYLHPNHDEFSRNFINEENIVCTYQDIAYLMEGTLTKVFVELDLVFANGTALTFKGNESIITLANEYKIPVVGYSGTWNFNGWNFLSLNMFLNKYGQQHLQKYEVIENQCFQTIVLQIGSIIPKQISSHLENLSKIYRGCDLTNIKW